MAIDADRLRRESVYESQAPLAALAEDLAQIERLAGGWRAIRKKLHIAAGILLAVGFICLFPLPPLVGVAMMAASIGLFIYARRQGRAVVLNVGRCAVVRDLGLMLSDDTGGQTPVAVRVLFDAKREMLSEREWPQRKKGKEKFFRSPWCTLETRLLDGTDFSESVDDLIRERTYVNPRGKRKTKTRTRNIVSLRFAYRSEVYGDVSKLGGRLAKEIQLPPSAILRGLEASERQVKAKALVKQTAEVVQASRMLSLGVYRVLNLSQRMLRPRREGGAR